jgi:transposase-like protein
MEETLRKQYPFVNKIAIAAEAVQDQAFRQAYAPDLSNFTPESVLEWKRIYDKMKEGRKCRVKSRLGAVSPEQAEEWRKTYEELKNIDIKESRHKVTFVDHWTGRPLKYQQCSYYDNSSEYNHETKNWEHSFKYWDHESKTWVEADEFQYFS